MEGQGIDEGKSDNMHDDPIITLNMFIDDPNSVRYDERVKAGKATINGVIDRRQAKNTELAKKIVEFRATKTIEAINKPIAAKKQGDFFAAVTLRYVRFQNCDMLTGGLTSARPFLLTRGCEASCAPTS